MHAPTTPPMLPACDQHEPQPSELTRTWRTRRRSNAHPFIRRAQHPLSAFFRLHVVVGRNPDLQYLFGLLIAVSVMNH